MMRPSQTVLNRYIQRLTPTTSHPRHNHRAASDLAQTDQKNQVLRQHRTLILQKNDHHVLRGNRTKTLTSQNH